MRLGHQMYRELRFFAKLCGIWSRLLSKTIAEKYSQRTLRRRIDGKSNSHDAKRTYIVKTDPFQHSVTLSSVIRRLDDLGTQRKSDGVPFQFKLGFFSLVCSFIWRRSGRVGQSVITFLFLLVHLKPTPEPTRGRLKLRERGIMSAFLQKSKNSNDDSSDGSNLPP